MEFPGKWPAEIDSIDREARTVRVRIPGVTDGAQEMPIAQLCYPMGDKSEHTEIRILEGDRVWVEFERFDPRYPIIVGFRPRNVENGTGWRRFHHDNIELDADGEVLIKAGSKITLKVGGSTIVIDGSGITANGGQINLN